MYSFPNLEPVCCTMSSSNYCFLTCIQISQEAGQVVGIPISWRIFHSFLWSMQSKVLAFLSLLSVLWNSAFKLVYLSFFPWPLASLPFSAIWKASSDNRFVFLHFFFLGWSWSLPPVQYHEPLSIVPQALCLSDLIPWIYLSLPLYNLKGFDLGHTWMV